MFKTSQITAGSAIATSGTAVFSYPENTSAGNFAAYGHKLWVDKHQKLYASPSDFTVSFGASTITVTYLGATTIPTGARLNAQFNIEGTDSGELLIDVDPIEIHNIALAQPVRIDLGSPDTADADGYFVSQNLTTAGVASVSTTVAAAIAAAALVGTADVPRNVVAAWTATAVLTVTGKDEYNNTIVESSGSGTSFTGKKAFKTVTGISVSANVTSLTVGTGTKLGLPFFVGDAGKIIAEYEGGTFLTRKNNKVYLMGTALEADVDGAVGYNMVSPVAGTIKKAQAVLNATVTTGGDITFEVNGTAVDGLTLTVANSDTEGTRYTDTPTAGHASTAVAVGDRIEVQFGSALNASANVFFIIEIELSADQQLTGTFVGGVSSAATATTGDVRGTYTPYTTPDGATSETLVVITTAPTYKGVAQYAG